MKKKRQSEPCGDIDNESTESCEDNQNKTSCNHTLKAIDLSKVKKILKTGLDVECAECVKDVNVEPAPEDSDDFEYDLRLWLCLKCGNQACGRSRRKHALKHFHTPHSESHALCVNTTSWVVWCYECDREISPNSKRKLLEVYEYIKKQSSNQIKGSPKMEETSVSSITIETSEKSSTVEVKLPTIENLPRVRGLANLGNTCFFNAVLQCLARTPFLVPVLKETSEEGEKFRLPGGEFKFKDKIEELPPIEGELASWGPLSETLANTLQDLQNSGGVVNAKSLLRLLASKQPQFGVGDQEDSHELLRHLLEAVRTEDLKRYQRIILQETKISIKSNPATIDEETTQKVKFYGLQASDMILRPEQVFRGVLVSTLQCQDCLHTSTREESFLDLSLPIMPDKPQPPIMRRKSELDDDKPSKHQVKKEKKHARKLAKKHKSNKMTHHHDGGKGEEIITEENNTVTNNSGESEQSDADIEDNLEDVTKILSTPDDDKSEKIDSPEKDGSIATSTLNDMNLKLTDIYRDYNNPHHRNDLQELTNRLQAAGSVSISDEKVPPQEIHSVSRNVSPNSSECSELSSSSPDHPHNTQTTGNSPDKVNHSSPPSDNKTHDWHELNAPPPAIPVQAAPWHNNVDIFSYNLPPEDNRNFYPRDNCWSSTIGARYQCDDSECSIQSCLNQFTSVELMTGNNKVCCEACTKRSKDGKNIYTNSTKQLLIASPPAVLILHLKRFQVFRSLFRKMSKPVTFPLILDLAPFCSNKCKTLPTIQNQQNRLLYALYGVVEHSGTLHGGHYVAYVKVRPTLEVNDYRHKFLPRIGSKSLNNEKKVDTENVVVDDVVVVDDNVVEDGAVGVSDPKPPPGKWYYVSDSQVSEVSESQVLKVQAYLLFYERIL